MGNLFIVATPIGNLEDITLRAIDVLKNVDLILCEDTRKTKILLDHYQIKTATLSYHQHSKLQKIEDITNLLKLGRNLALVSDAGTPGISDPGNILIQKTTELLDNSVKIIAIPGASAVTAIASISGFSTDKFLFLGFLPIKNKRKKIFEEISKSQYPVIFYESPYRIIKTLKELCFFCANQEIVVCRELTKKFEQVFRGKIEKVIEEIEKSPMKGEFTVVVKNK